MVRTGLLLLLFLSACSSEPPRYPIIDMHLHAYDMGWSGGRVLGHPLTGKASAARTDEALLRVTLETMDRYNIVRAVASGPLDVVRTWTEAAPDRFIGGAMFTGGPSTYTPTPSLDALRTGVRDGAIGVIGELASQYAGLAPDDPALEPYFELAEDLRLPVGIHMGTSGGHATYRCCPGYRMALGNPLLLEDVLARHPKLKVYVMHAGWPMGDAMLALMHGHPQVYADLSSISWSIPRAEFHRYVRRLVEAGLGKRLMFGSDQMVWPELIETAIESIHTADFLSEDQKKDIFYNNAATFLGF